MHIPYGMLDNPMTLVSTNGVAVAGIAIAVSKIRRQLASRLVPLLASTSAFIFSAQMVNFGVGGGTSGHLIGGTLAAVLLGPWGAMVSLSLVLVVQCLMFGDGGLLELGANVFNMAIVGGGGAWCIYRAVQTSFAWRRPPGTVAGEPTNPHRNLATVVAAVIAAWLSVVSASACCAVELAAAGTARLGPTLSAMVGVHSLIGIGEAAITGLIVAALLQLRPELIDGYSRDREITQLQVWPTAIACLFVAGAVAAFLAPAASELPDGLEAVAKSLGFADKENPNAIVPAPIAEYEMPGLKDLAIAKSIAGLIGVVAVTAISLLLGRTVIRRTHPIPASAIS